MIIFGTIFGLVLYFGAIIIIAINMIRVTMNKTTLNLKILISLPFIILGFIFAFISLNTIPIAYHFILELFLTPLLSLMVALFFLFFFNKKHKENMLNIKQIIYEFSLFFTTCGIAFSVLLVNLLTVATLNIVVMLCSILSIGLLMFLSCYYVLKLRKIFTKS